MNSFNILNYKHYEWLFCFLILIFPVMTNAASGKNETASNLFPSLLQTLDYLAVDYPAVVNDGKIVDSGEYAEQQEMAQRVGKLLQQLPPGEGKKQLVVQGAELQTAINELQPGAAVQSLSRRMSTTILTIYNVDTAPRAAPSLDEAAVLYQENCSVCHGIQGYGDGIQAASLQPPPANFHNAARQQQMSVYGLFNTITLGVNETPMRAFSHLSDQQRWALAFYVSTFLAEESASARGQALWEQGNYNNRFDSLNRLVRTSPQTALEQWGQDGADVMAFLRRHPEAMQLAGNSPVQLSREYLSRSLHRYRVGEYETAYEWALAAYLEGFELIEKHLKTIAPGLRNEVEQAMSAYRNDIKAKVITGQLEQEYATLMTLLDKTDTVLQKSQSSWMNFFSAFLILLREGLEAILVLAAIAAFVIKAGQRKVLRFVHAGWVAALVMGGMTWFLAGRFIHISGSNRELTEGLIALITAAMLIYVGFWLHNQANSQQWQQLIRDKVSHSVTQGAYWGLSLIAFFAVYREVFESILFYQSLWMQSLPTGKMHIVGGAVTAAMLLLLLGWLIFKFSIKLPLKLFFRVNAVLLFGLAIIFTGKGVAALQEAGTLPMDPVAFPEIGLLGIYPNAETLGVQFGLICLALAWISYTRIRASRRMTEPV